ncbi:MAG: hypothetical protein GTN82_02805 [Candidatus Aminicenantes bacterium]|nr:hypothetical protein [Candidatus Aminicenantes bacterium]
MNKRGVVYFAPYGFSCGSGTTLRSLNKISFKDISCQSAADFFEFIIHKGMEVDL